MTFNERQMEGNKCKVHVKKMSRPYPGESEREKDDQK